MDIIIKCLALTSIMATCFICINMSIKLYYMIKFKYLLRMAEKMMNTGTNEQNKIILISDITPSNISIYFFSNYIVNMTQTAKISSLLLNNYDKNIHIIITTFGGSVMDCSTMVKYLEDKKAIIYVPEWAFSAGTILTLCGEKIYMDKYSCLGPTDPQLEINGVTRSFYDIDKLMKTKSINYIDNDTIMEYYELQKINENNKLLTSKLVKKHVKQNVGEKTVKKFINKLTDGKIEHGTPIYSDEISKILNVDLNMPYYVKQIALFQKYL